MAANKVADTSKLAEARRAELDWAAGKESAIVSGDKRGLQENRQFTRPAGLSPANAEVPPTQTATEETRENLKAIEKNKSAEDLRRTLTARLSKASARLDEVTKRLIQVHMQVKELELRFREAVKLVRIPARA